MNYRAASLASVSDTQVEMIVKNRTSTNTIVAMQS